MKARLTLGLLVTAAISAVAGSAGGASPGPVVRLAFTGDIAMVAGPADDYFRSVRKQLAGDVVLGNLEGTLTERGTPKCGSGSSDCFSFHAPPSLCPVAESGRVHGR